MFALMMTPLKAQPPNYPPADLGTSGDVPDVVWDPYFTWEVQNNVAGCDAEFIFWFRITRPGNITEDREAPPIIVSGESSGSITNGGLASYWSLSGFTSITHVAGWIKLGNATGFQPLYPSGGTISGTGATPPCDCYHYEFDFSQPGKAIVIITRPSPPCP